jgi:hypothetical protein
MKMTLNKERINLLLTALRSGKYEQGKGVLKIDNGTAMGAEYCCMGVACETFKIATGKGRWMQNDTISFLSTFYPHEDDTDKERFAMPDAVAQWFGFDGQNPRISGYRLSVRNDDREESFSTIADVIEKVMNEQENEDDTE